MLQNASNLQIEIISQKISQGHKVCQICQNCVCVPRCSHSVDDTVRPRSGSSIICRQRQWRLTRNEQQPALDAKQKEFGIAWQYRTKNSQNCNGLKTGNHQCHQCVLSGVSGASQCKSYPAANSDLTKENRLTMARLCLQAIGEISRVLDSNSLLRCHAPESYRTI